MANKDYTVSVRLRNPARATDVTSSNNPTHTPEKDVEVVVSAANPQEAMEAAIKQVDPEGKYEARGRAVNEGASESEDAITDGSAVDFVEEGDEEGGESDGDDTYLEDEDRQLGINEDPDAPATIQRQRSRPVSKKKKVAHKKR